MDTLGKRIKFIRERLRFNQSELARYLGLESPMAISKYETDQREPDIDKLIKLSKLGDLSLDWLLTGEGEMQRSEVKHPVVFEPVAAYNAGDSELREICEFLKESPVDKKLILKVVKAKKELKKATREAMEGLIGVKGLVEES